MDNIVETLAKKIAEFTGNAEEARHLVGELAKIDWQAYLSGTGIQAYFSTSLTARVSQLEQEVAALKEQLPNKKTKPAKKKTHPAISGQPEGTMFARDFYEMYGVSHGRLRYHTEKGFYGERIETTEIPHPTRPGFRERVLTPEQQKRVIEYWDKYGVDYAELED
jgi:hypothetical protein